MKHLFATTALAAALSVGAAQAQQTQTDPTPAPQDSAATAEAPVPTIAPPDGYVEGEVTLTTENLEGATVYDASGDDIGTVHGLVFANGTTSMQDADAAPAPGGTAPETAPAATTGAASTAGDTATPGASAPDTMGTVDSSTASPQASAPATDSESDNVASGTDTGENDRIDNVGSDATTVTPTDATTPPAQSATDTQQPAGGMAGTEISHAIIDVGGFLGIGKHRVAVPVDDLVVYRKDTDLRIYLPWTKQQVEALPEFDEDGPAPAAQ
ncbi:photosystem reaction center protein H [Paracoccus aminovorans]|uniref:photosystem reaction center protein H n=1 Tax=Paracoccus aminovorans TaxID=34004 RepID=UPI002B25C203|nr:photosystem reaction center protein H [Paracoccus aminovorans]